jgi:hypothetical protein
MDSRARRSQAVGLHLQFAHRAWFELWSARDLQLCWQVDMQDAVLFAFVRMLAWVHLNAQHEPVKACALAGIIKQHLLY